MSSVSSIVADIGTFGKSSIFGSTGRPWMHTRKKHRIFTQNHVLFLFCVNKYSFLMIKNADADDASCKMIQKVKKLHRMWVCAYEAETKILVPCYNGEAARPQHPKHRKGESDAIGKWIIVRSRDSTLFIGTAPIIPD